MTCPPPCPPSPDAAYWAGRKRREAHDARMFFGSLAAVMAVVLALVKVTIDRVPETRLLAETPEGCRVYELKRAGRIDVCPAGWTTRP